MNDKSTVGNTAVVALHLFCGDEVNDRVVIGKIVGHGDDFALDASEVCTLTGNNKAFTQVLLACGKLGIGTASYRAQSILFGNGVLLCIGNALNAANGIGVTLAHALAPECISLAFGQDRLGIKAVDREHTGIPTAGDNGNVAALARGCIHVCKMLGDLCVCIKAINNREVLGNHGGLIGKIGGTAATEDHHINFANHILNIINMINSSCLRKNFDGFGRAARKDGNQIHIRVLCDGTFHTATEISVTNNSYANAHNRPPLGLGFSTHYCNTKEGRCQEFY